MCAVHTYPRGPGNPRVAPSHLLAPCWPGTLPSRAVLSLRPLHLLWYWPHFSHLSVPELPDCATLGGTIGVVSDVKGALGTRLRIADLPCWPCGDAWGKTAGCTSVSLGAGSAAGLSPTSLGVLFPSSSFLPALLCNPGPVGKIFRGPRPRRMAPLSLLLMMIICMICFTIYAHFEHNL